MIHYLMDDCTQIKATKDKSPWEQYHITPLSHVALYRIWSMLDSGERLLVTGVSPLIFGSQHGCRFLNRMQLNMRDLRLNTLYNKLSFLLNPDRQALNTKWYESKRFDSFYWSIKVGMLKARNLRNDLKWENGNMQEDGTEIDTHYTSKNGR